MNKEKCEHSYGVLHSRKYLLLIGGPDAINECEEEYKKFSNFEDFLKRFSHCPKCGEKLEGDED